MYIREMKNKGLHKVSHYIVKGTKTIVLNVHIGTNKLNVFEGIKRVLFIADVDYEDVSYSGLDFFCKAGEKPPIKYLMNIKFIRYNQLKYIIPIINENMEKLGYTEKDVPFYYIDDKCKNFFKE